MFSSPPDLDWSKLLEAQRYLLFLLAVMVIAGILRDRDVVTPLYAFLARRIANRKVLVSVLATILGVLPIAGRVTVTAGLLDTLTDRTRDVRAFGVVAYLATHHYYLWSPLEKSVVVTMAGLNLTYGQFLSYTAIPLLISLAITYGYIALRIREEDLPLRAAPAGDVRAGALADLMLLFAIIALAVVTALVAPEGKSNGPIPEAVLPLLNLEWLFPMLAVFYIVRHRPTLARLRGYINGPLVAFVAVLIPFAWFVQGYSGAVMDWVKGQGVAIPVFWAALAGFLLAFALGSSSRYAAIAVATTSVFGLAYLPLFYLVDFAGYLLSPVHKCTVIGWMYFRTPLRHYYFVLCLWCAALIAYGALASAALR